MATGITARNAIALKMLFQPIREIMLPMSWPVGAFRGEPAPFMINNWGVAESVVNGAFLKVAADMVMTHMIWRLVSRLPRWLSFFLWMF